MFRIALAVSAAALAGLAPVSQARASAAKCSGLRVTTMSNGTTYSAAVEHLKARNPATCRVARKIARVVANDILKSTEVPAKIKGYAVTVTAPCTACTPVYDVVAKMGSGRVTFDVRGGA